METRLFRHDRVDSTSERAFASLAAGEAQHLDAHLAREQTAGRGRLGRTWHSAPGEGLYLSVVLLPPPPPPHPARLTMAAGLAALETVVELGAPREALRLKWPNDLLAGGAKLAGILVESRGLDPRLPHYVVGIGLNVAQERFPPVLTAERPATSLALLGIESSVERVAELLRAALARQLEAADEVLCAGFLVATGLAGREVVARTARNEERGLLARIDLERGLRIETPAGTRALPLEHVTALAPAQP